MPASSKNRITRLMRNNSKPLLKREKVWGSFLDNGMLTSFSRAANRASEPHPMVLVWQLNETAQH